MSALYARVSQTTGDLWRVLHATPQAHTAKMPAPVRKIRFVQIPARLIQIAVATKADTNPATLTTGAAFHPLGDTSIPASAATAIAASVSVGCVLHHGSCSA